MKTLNDWLAHCERLHPKTIDMTLARVEAVRDRLGLRFDCPVVTVAGTNGKGSSCAMLESIALQAGYRVGLYIKPHFVHFGERCRVGGDSVSDESLLPHFEAVEAARGELQLTYFEFTTLAILRRLASEPLDLVILEVGLGGRLDAVNAIDPDVALITSIALDHTEYLGPDRESIGREKAGILRAGRAAVCADPQPPASIAARATELGADLRQSGRDFHFEGDRQQWRWQGRERRYAGLAYPALRGANQLLNAAGVLAAFEALHERLPINAQAVRNGLALVELAGRFQVLPGQPTVILDVAHNPHAVATLAQNLDQLGFAPQTRAVFGAMGDKALDEIFQKIAPWITEWHFCDLPTPRAAPAAELAARWQALVDAGQVKLVPMHTHADPFAALGAARAASEPTDRIIVFGSFFTVGGVMAGLQGARRPAPAPPDTRPRSSRMGLLSFLRLGSSDRSATPPATTKRGKKAAAVDGHETLQRLRQQARRRLLGAAVLVGIGIVAFPLVFETQPRPVPMDLPIVIPAKEATVAPQAAPAALPTQLPDDAEVQAAADAASLPEPAAPPARSSEPLPQAEPPKAKTETVKAKPEAVAPKMAATPATKPASSTAANTARYVVQVGAFADKQAAQVARQKLERKGLKTYAQVAKTPQGDRIRVRLGPFNSKADADKAAQQAKAVGLAGAVLAL